MPSAKIKKLLENYFSAAVTTDDLGRLELWILKPENISVFKDYVKTNFAIQLSMNDSDPSILKERLLKEIRMDKRILLNRTMRKYSKYAAVAILFLGIGYFIKNDFFEEAQLDAVIPKEDVVTLQLENGDVEILSKNSSSEVKNGQGEIVGVQKGSRLVYKDKIKNVILAYNTLKVPYGKRFDIVLSDGTEVFLNAGSTLKYPVQFLTDSVRQVVLEGEAYFEVSHDSKNAFSVVSQGLSVTVLGTKFNVSNYEEDPQTEVVLVDGSVRLTPLKNSMGNTNTTLLEPGLKGTFNKVQKKITKEEVNTSLYTSWVRGQVMFRNSTFENIIKKLQRHYNVVIINNNSELANETFNASIDVETEGIEQVLEYFNKIYGIDYEIVSNKIIIN